MKMRQFSVLTLVALFALASAAFAQGPHHPAGPPPAGPAMEGPGGEMMPGGPPCMMGMGMGMRGHGMAFLEKKLGLTDEQKTQLRSLRVGFQDRTRKARMDLISLKDEKLTMLMSGKVDQKKLAAMDDQIIKLKTEILTEKLKAKRDKLALLTPEQLDKLGDLISHKPFGLGKHGGRGMGGGEHGGGHGYDL